MNNGAGSTFTEGWDALEAAFLAAVVSQQTELWPSKRVDVEVRLSRRPKNMDAYYAERFIADPAEQR